MTFDGSLDPESIQAGIGGAVLEEAASFLVCWKSSAMDINDVEVKALLKGYRRKERASNIRFECLSKTHI